MCSILYPSGQFNGLLGGGRIGVVGNQIPKAALERLPYFFPLRVAEFSII